MTLLDNPAWSALTTHQAHLARGGSLSRRYPEHVAPIAAVARPEAAAVDELAGLVVDGSWLSLPATLEGLGPMMPPRLSVTLEKRLVQMVCRRQVAVPAGELDIVALSEGDIPEMVALTALTHPGPFRPDTYTLGLYLGIRVDGRLAAMGGQRMHLPGYREMSAICTHPDFQRRGYARQILARLVEKTYEEGLTPFLHVEAANLGAQAVYRELGFEERARLPLLVVERAQG
jgi:ribosomal protein S18 acetylase RimI-like enzyme